MNCARSLLRALTVLGAVYLGAFATAISAEPTLRPGLPAQTWREHQHVMGFVSVTGSGELRFARFLSEDTAEPDHPGFWIESLKVDEIRRVLPSVLLQFRFGEVIVIDGVKYLRVMPAKPKNGLGHRTAEIDATAAQIL